MALIEWKEEFKLGIPSVDHEHHQLIDLINQAHAEMMGAGSEASVADFLAEIHSRIASHFALEERIMRASRYREYEEHKADHERLLDAIREIMENYELGAYEDYHETLGRHLEEWFTVHFKTKDARLHAFLD